jgi:hypothetical protein
MSTSTIRAAIAATISGISGIGLVHEFERYSKRQSDFVEFFTEGRKLLGWIVQRRGTEERAAAVDYNRVIDRWEITGFMALEDAAQTELTFNTKIDEIRDAFRSDETIGGVVESIQVNGLYGVQVDGIEPVMFGATLCHRARLSLSTVTTIDIAADPEDDFSAGNVKWDMAPVDDVIDAEDILAPEND